MSISASAVASGLGIGTEFRDARAGQILNLPQGVAVIGQGASTVTYPTTKEQVFSADAVGAKYGQGSPLHLMVRELLPANGDGVSPVPVWVYPLVDDGAGVPAAGDVTPSGTATAASSEYFLRISGILSQPFSIPAGAITVADVIDAMVAAVNAVLEMPVIAANNADTDMTLTAKWDGATGNDIVVEVVNPDVGVAFAITQPAAGANNPDVQDALDQVGTAWAGEATMVLNGAADIADATSLDAFQTWGDGRWGALVHMPAVVFTGNTIAAVASAYAVSDARPTDLVNSNLVGPGSPNLPCVVAARQLARIIVEANGNPPTAYNGDIATGLIPGTDAEQWDYTMKDAAVKAGCSTTDKVDGRIRIGDVVTFYHPSGEAIPPYRYVVDIVKLQNILYNLNLIFSAKEWAAAPMIPDSQTTTNPKARKPSDAKTVVNAMLDSLGNAAIISDPAAAKKKTFVGINAQNPKRLDIKVYVQLSGNTFIKDVELFFSFFFGQAAAA